MEKPARASHGTFVRNKEGEKMEFREIDQTNYWECMSLKVTGDADGERVIEL